MKVDYIVEADMNTEQLIYLLLREHVVWNDALNSYTYQNRGVFTGSAVFPNMVSISYIGINDKVVCFYWGTGELVDHPKIEHYMKKEYPDSEMIDSNQLVFKFREF